MDNSTFDEKFAAFVKKSKGSNWKDIAAYRAENRGWLRKAASIALTILENLEMKGMTKADLAEKMSVSRERVNEIVKGRENLTLQTIAALEEALGIVIIDEDE